MLHARMSPSSRTWRWAPPEEWDAMIAVSPCATPFHGRAWCEAYAACDRRFDVRALGLRLEDGGDVLMPLFARRGMLRKGPFARAVAAQPGVYGGPLLPRGGLSPEEWAGFASAARSLPFGRIDVFGNVLDPLPPAIAAAFGARSRTTHVVELDRLPEDPIESYEPACRRNVRKSEREGVVVSRESSAAAVREYFAIYRDSLRRWGKGESEGYPIEWISGLVAAPSVELWCARIADGRMAAGGLFVFAPRHTVYWHGAMLDELSAARPANALHHALIAESRRRGCRLYDFNPSGGHPGTDEFKRSFGAREREFSIWSLRSPIADKVAARARRAQERRA
jgi:CelD/BcsL family acetyltransferase involved in cellulose biosynthesis